MEFPHVRQNGEDRLRILHPFISADGFICTDGWRSGRRKSTNQWHPPGPANVGGLNNVLADPSGIGNASRMAPLPPPLITVPVIPQFK